jgi:hypothetical protein
VLVLAVKFGSAGALQTVRRGGTIDKSTTLVGAVVIDDRQIPVFHRRSPIRKMKKGRAGEAHREMRIQTETTICCAIDPDHKS